MLNSSGAVMEQFNNIVDFIHRPFKNRIARLILITLGITLSYSLLFNVYEVAEKATSLGLGYLTLLMIALSASFINGLGFYPRFWLWKFLFSPCFSWLVLLIFSIFILI